MKPHNFRIGVRRHGESSAELIITTEDNQFIGLGVLRTLPETKAMEVVSAVARPTFGTFLYQTMAKYAFMVDRSITASRDACTRGPALAIWRSFHKTFNASNILPLPEFLNDEVLEGLEEDEAKAFLVSYRMPVSEAFKSNFTDLNKDISSDTASDLLSAIKEADEFFGISYGMDSSSWINEDFPLREDQQVSYPVRERIKLDDILIDKGTFDAVVKDIEEGRVSRSNNPITCVIDIDGDVVFVDGHHRFVEAIMRGESDIDGTIEHNEYLHGFIEDVHRPDKQSLISLKQMKASLSLDTPAKQIDSDDEMVM